MDVSVLPANIRALLLVGIVIVLGGCNTANQNSINRKFYPTGGDSRLIDVKQRAIISIKRDREKGVTDVAVCAEPSPDALQALGTAFAGAGSSEGLKTALNLAFSKSESAASIGLRTQSIQLLRDAYYRLCEAFLNDGIDSIAYDVLQRRFQNQIVALLAVEQLTGTVKANQANLSTSTVANAGAQAGLIAQMLDTAEEELERLRKEQDKNDATLNALNKEREELGKQKAAVEKDLATDAANPQLKEQQESTARALELKDAEVKAAEGRRQRLADRIERKERQIAALTVAFGEAAQATITSGATGVGTLGLGGTTSNVSHTSEVVNAVRAITLNAINQDYEGQVCFEALRPRNHLRQFRNQPTFQFKKQEKAAGADTAGAQTRQLEPNQTEQKSAAAGNLNATGNLFIDYCRIVVDERGKLRMARSKLIDAYGSVVEHLKGNIGEGPAKISAQEAFDLILAVSYAAPMEPGAGFLKRRIENTKEKPDSARPDGVNAGSFAESFVKAINSKIMSKNPTATKGEPNESDHSAALKKIIALLTKPVAKEVREAAEALRVSALDLQKERQLAEQAQKTMVEVLKAEVGKQVKKLREKAAAIEKQRAVGKQITVKGVTQKEVVVPIDMKTTTAIGPSSFVLRCEKGKKLNTEQTKCVPRCDREGVRYDPEHNECIPTTP